MGFVNTKDNVKIFYRLIGNGPKTILFLHPPGMGHVTFKQQLPLCNQYRLLYLDLRGNGNSERSDSPISFPLLANDIYEVCQQLNMENVFICGYSNGASIALETSITYPDMVEGLILVGAFPKVNSILLYSEFLLGILASHLNGMELIAKVIAKAHAYSNEYGEEISSYIMKTTPETLKEYYKEGLRYNCTERLKDITSPILLVYGERDYFVHHYQNEFLSLLPETKVVYVTGAKHQVPTKFPNELNIIIEKFIEKLMGNLADRKSPDH